MDIGYELVDATELNLDDKVYPVFMAGEPETVTYLGLTPDTNIQTVTTEGPQGVTRYGQLHFHRRLFARKVK